MRFGFFGRCLLAATLLHLSLTSPTVSASDVTTDVPHHTFAIGQDAFLLDGKPLVIRCGEIHFPRVPREYWQHRLKMCKALGLNTVCVYLFWNFHEWEEGKFDWQGQADVAEFCRLAQAEGLWVLLRPGPYSCAEWEMGGLPWWLVKHDQIALRSRDPKFLEPAVRYLKEVGRVLAPLQITRGGPLLMVQVENEYGSYGEDAEYMGVMRQALIDGGFNVPLFACNPPGAIAKGYRDDLFQVVNFGRDAAAKSFEVLRSYQKTGPMMNGEYYPAWFDTWGNPHKTGNLKAILADLDYMLTNKYSFSLYMAHGGTSFGLWSGANRPFRPDTSSYDYEAPISEAGWVTPKFTAVHDVMAKHLPPGETIPPPPAPNPVIAIEPTTLTQTASIYDNLPAPKLDRTPRHMEAYDQSRGCMVYRTTVPAGPAGTLAINGVHDFAWIRLDGKPIGVMDRRGLRFRIRLPARSAPAQLDIFLEAMGRVNFGREIYDRKGLIAPVTIIADRTSTELTNWQVYSLPLDQSELAGLKYQDKPAEGPAFWRGTFNVATPGDTFLDLRTWSKGVVWVNGHCLARFWDIGPTQTAYVPGPWLKKGANEIVVLDVIGPRKPVVAGLTAPILDELHPELDLSLPSRAQGTPTLANPVQSGSFTSDIQWQTATLSKPATGRYVALEIVNVQEDKEIAAIAELEFGAPNGEVLSNSNWKILWVDSEDRSGVGDVENILDGQPATIWKNKGGKENSALPHRIVIDLGETRTIGSLRYLPRSDSAKNSGGIKDWKVYVSDKPFGLNTEGSSGNGTP
jgi:beta-galactosidase